jgi:hypothetical protein
MLATLAADPLASLVDTAFVGHLGAAQLAGEFESLVKLSRLMSNCHCHI